MIEWTFEGCLNRKKYGVPGTEPVIRSACMIVHESVDFYVKLSGTTLIVRLAPQANYLLELF